MRSLLRAIALLVVLTAATPAVAQASRTATTYVVRAGDTLFRISRQTGVSVNDLRRLNGLTSDRIDVGQTLRLTALVALPPRPPTGTDGTPARLPTTPTRDTHVVQSGETLFGIATRYGTTVDELRRLNGIVGDNIAAGRGGGAGRAGADSRHGQPAAGRRLTVPAVGARPAGATAAAGDPGPAGPRVDAPVESGPPPSEPPPIELGTWRIDDTTVPADVVHFVEPGETVYSIAVRYGFSADAITAVNALTTAPLQPGTLLVLPRAVDPSVPHEVALPPVDTDGLALVYDPAMAGRTTASGEAYDPAALTAAHRDLPLGTVLLVTNTASGRSVFVRINDRGPLSSAYVIELSAAAAGALELDPDAARRVELRRVP